MFNACVNHKPVLFIYNSINFVIICYIVFSDTSVYIYYIILYMAYNLHMPLSYGLLSERETLL